MVTKIESVATKGPAEKRARGVSGIASPYFDNDASLKVADVIQNVGGGSCASDFLAAKLGYASTRSGTYLTRVAAARMFGYVTTAGGNFVVTERGRAALSPVMPEDSVNARADAFLAVPLFARMYEDFNGRTLPPQVGITNLFLNTYRILPDRVSDALRVFMNSASQCGFFHAGRDRLIRPTVATSAVTLPEIQGSGTAESTPTAEKPRVGGGGGGGGDGAGIHSALIGLLRELPKSGEPWNEKEQQDFIAAFTGLIKFIFPARGEEKSGKVDYMKTLDGKK